MTDRWLPADTSRLDTGSVHVTSAEVTRWIERHAIGEPLTPWQRDIIDRFFPDAAGGATTTQTPEEMGERGECAVCHRTNLGIYVPSGGDGVVRRPRRHNGNDGKVCAGRFEPALGWS